MAWVRAGAWGSDNFVDSDGVPHPAGTAVDVFLPGTTAYTTLWDGRAKDNEVDNPIILEEVGNVRFYAVPADYDIVVDGTRLRVTALPDPEEDRAGGGGGSLDPVVGPVFVAQLDPEVSVSPTSTAWETVKEFLNNYFVEVPEEGSALVFYNQTTGYEQTITASDGTLEPRDTDLATHQYAAEAAGVAIAYTKEMYEEFSVIVANEDNEPVPLVIPDGEMGPARVDGILTTVPIDGSGGGSGGTVLGVETLRPFLNAHANAATEVVPIYLVTSSIGVGLRVSADHEWERRWPGVLERYMAGDVARGWMPAGDPGYAFPYAAPSTKLTLTAAGSGGAGNNARVDKGIGNTAYKMALNAQMTATAITGATSVRVGWVTQKTGSGSLEVLVNDADLHTFNTNDAALGTGEEGWAWSDPIDLDPTVANIIKVKNITAAGTIFDGLYFHRYNEDTGHQFIQGGFGAGGTLVDFTTNTSWLDAAEEIGTRCLIVELGVNDYTGVTTTQFKNRWDDFLDLVEARLPDITVILVGDYKVLDRDDWIDYVAKENEVAKERNLTFIRLDKLLDADDAENNGLWTDEVHPDDAGHESIGAYVMAALPIQPALGGLLIDIQEFTGLEASYSSPVIDGHRLLRDIHETTLATGLKVAGFGPAWVTPAMMTANAKSASYHTLDVSDIPGLDPDDHGTVHNAIQAIQAQTVESALGLLYPHQLGPYFDDFSAGPFLGAIPNGWTSFHTVTPHREDPIGLIADGPGGAWRLGITELQGPANQDPDYSGWRSGMYRECGPMAGVSVKCTVDISVGTATGGPLAYCDPSTTEYGVGCWHSAYGWWELGFIGHEQPDFDYGDFFIDAYSGPTTVVMELRSDGQYIALYVDDVLKCGPVPIPDSLIEATCHGVQLDYLGSEGVGCVSDVEIEPYFGNLTPLPTPSYLSRGSVVELASASTLPLDCPSTVNAGDLLIAFVHCTNAAVTATGWTNQSLGGGSPDMAMLTKVAVGSEDSTTVNFVSSGGTGAMAGSILRFSGASGAEGLAQDNSSSTSAPSSSASRVLGPHRLAWLAVACAADRTVAVPPGWTQRASTAAGTPNVTLYVFTRPLDAYGTLDPPYVGYYQGDPGDRVPPCVPTTTAILSTAAANTVGIGQIRPKP